MFAPTRPLALLRGDLAPLTHGVLSATRALTPRANREAALALRDALSARGGALACSTCAARAGFLFAEAEGSDNASVRRASLRLMEHLAAAHQWDEWDEARKG